MTTMKFLHDPQETPEAPPRDLLAHAQRAIMLRFNTGATYARYATANGLAYTELVTACGALAALEPFGGMSSQYRGLHTVILAQGGMLKDRQQRAMFFDWAMREEASQAMAVRASRLLRAGKTAIEALAPRKVARHSNPNLPPPAAPIASNLAFWAAAKDTVARIASVNAIALTFVARVMAFEEVVGATLNPKDRALIEARVKAIHADLMRDEKENAVGI